MTAATRALRARHGFDEYPITGGRTRAQCVCGWTGQLCGHPDRAAAVREHRDHVYAHATPDSPRGREFAMTQPQPTPPPRSGNATMNDRIRRRGVPPTAESVLDDIAAVAASLDAEARDEFKDAVLEAIDAQGQEAPQ